MAEPSEAKPDSTAVRVALWRALHVQVDSPPHIFEDEVGLRLLDPEDGWQKRQDMDPAATRLFRASIVARARFVEDLVLEEAARGLDQYVVLGAGIDTFLQRRPEWAARMKVFEIDRPGPQAWKRNRLEQLGFRVAEQPQFVSVDFEGNEAWQPRLLGAGFDPERPAVIAAAGVSMYLSKEAIDDMLRQIATFAAGSTLAMTFLLPFDQVEPDVRPGMEGAAAGARASGTPFVSFFTPEEMLERARYAGFAQARHVSAAELTERYFGGREDGLRPPYNAEEFLVATT